MTAANTPAEDPRIVEPEHHAARLHALIISLRNLNDTPLILADEEHTNNESRLLMRSLGFTVHLGG